MYRESRRRGILPRNILSRIGILSHCVSPASFFLKIRFLETFWGDGFGEAGRPFLAWGNPFPDVLSGSV